MARHVRQSCGVWDPGGGPTAVSGERPKEEEEEEEEEEELKRKEE